MKSCCFTGHRPKFFPWGNDTDDIRAKRLISALEEEIKIAIKDGYDRFLWGGALGVDTWTAKCVLKLKTQYPDITLTAVLPYKGYNDRDHQPSGAQRLKFSLRHKAPVIGLSGFGLRDLNKKEDEVRLYRIMDLSLNRSFGQRIFGVGTIHCCSAVHEYAGGCRYA